MKFADCDGVSLRFAREGLGDVTAVLLHELGGALDSFDAVAPILAVTGLAVLRYDARGAGLSEKPRRPFSLDDEADDLAALLDTLAIAAPVHLVGVAAGAAVAALFALRRPARVATLALCAPALSVPPDRRAYLVERSERAVRDGMRSIAEATLARSFPEHLRAETFSPYRARFLANDPVTYAHANLALAGSRVVERLGAIAHPCLVLAGRHDLLRPPSEVETVADRIPGARFAVLDSGHIMPVQAPDAMAAALLDHIAGARRLSPAAEART
ncbi:alpha/beta fold hydrolase [Lichenibacterium minor]|uniref:Alpha/beta fold hydrolase n=1 Tax=Lichenibacterium minor TaxID=2316528 RepID=A0A4Q2U613_9HYPH|nr:alpha/beta hydrolase [Lichenibacterium minor]RYC30276.1 alpha/beta fold hydrolase [Lichenibacterium minor]